MRYNLMAAALAASKLGVRVGHVEAGLRSNDRTMPEETNRVVADHISDQLYAPTEEARKNLAREGIDRGVTVTGNTIVDAVLENRKLAESRSQALENLGLRPREYILATAHRQENVDSRERLGNILRALDAVGRETGLPVIFPAHPRTQSRLKEARERLGGAAVRVPGLPEDGIRGEAAADRLRGSAGGGLRARGAVRHHAREHRAPGDGGGRGEHPGRHRSRAGAGCLVVDAEPPGRVEEPLRGREGRGPHPGPGGEGRGPVPQAVSGGRCPA